MATHIGVLDQGRVVQFGSPRDIYENPETLYVATRLGQPRINTLPADMFGRAPEGATVIALRPEHILQGQGMESRVVRVEHLGDQTRLHLKLAGHDIVTVTDAHTTLGVGDALAIAPQNPLYFNTAGARIAVKG